MWNILKDLVRLRPADPNLLQEIVKQVHLGLAWSASQSNRSPLKLAPGEELEELKRLLREINNQPVPDQGFFMSLQIWIEDQIQAMGDEAPQEVN